MKHGQLCQVFHTWMKIVLDKRTWCEPDGEFLEHLAMCSVCRQRWALVEVLLRTVQQWAVPEPATTVDQIVHRVMQERHQGLAERMRVVLGVSLVVAALAWLPMMQRQEPAQVALRSAVPATSVAAEQADQNAVTTDATLALSPEVTPSNSDARMELMQYPVQEVAYQLLPLHVRHTVGGMLEVLSPVLAMSDGQSEFPFGLGVVPVLPGLEEVWDPVLDVGKSGLRWFRNVLPPWFDQSHS